jgi:hypothetical protein
MKIGQRLRDTAAKICSARASAEAAEIQLAPRQTGACFTPQQWDIREQKLAHAAFWSVIDDGANPRDMADNWGEAESRLRTGEFPPVSMERIPGTKPTPAQRRREQRARRARERGKRRRHGR